MVDTSKMSARQEKRFDSITLDAKKLFEALNRERKRRGMTDAELSAELGIPPTTMRGWARGAYGANGTAALRVSLFLRADLRTFAKHDPPPAHQEAA